MQIRRFAPKDYPALANIHNVIHPAIDSTTAERYEAGDQRRNPSLKHGRWVAISQGEVVGVAHYSQARDEGDPVTLNIGVGMLPQYEGRGIGAALYDHLMTAVESVAPCVLETYGCADHPRSIRFLQDRGFEEYLREGDFELDITAFDTTPYISLKQELQVQGIELRTVDQLKNDLNRDRKLHDLYWELRNDVPGMPDVRPTAFDRWIQDYLHSPYAWEDGYIIAVYSEKYVGQTTLWTTGHPGVLHQKITGTRRDFRHRGIATVLKVCGIASARANGYSKILTNNGVDNHPMLAINERLGFVAQPVWVFFKKCLVEKE